MLPDGTVIALKWKNVLFLLKMQILKRIANTADSVSRVSLGLSVLKLFFFFAKDSDREREQRERLKQGPRRTDKIFTS